MPRVGINPARRRQSEYRPARVTVAVLTHVPELAGYFRQRFDVLRLSLSSLLANTAAPYDLLVFDNGSCEPVVAYLKGLRDAGQIDYLLLSSRNIGKIGAFQLLFRAAPGEVVAYSDDDVLFLPGWLQAHLEVLDAFPQAGMVSGVGIRVRFLDQTGATQAFAARPGVVSRQGKFIPDEWEREFVTNTGRDWDAYRRKTAPIQDLVLEMNGVEAFAAANHFQFVSPRQVILEALPQEWGGQLMGQMVELDRKVDDLGYLRLSTRQRMVRMMGNVVDEPLQALAQELGLPLAPEARRTGPAGGLWKSLGQSPGVNRLLRALYDRLYWILHD
jgi:glycosyltransferase involved in cell wall biosynthesis